MLLLDVSAHLYVVFLKDGRALEYLYLGSVACVCVRAWERGGWGGGGRRSPIWYVCVYLYTSLCEYCTSLCICNPRVLLRECRTVGVFVCICVDAGCTVDCALSDFVSGFLTHVLMAIKDFSLFGIRFLWTVFFRTNQGMKFLQGLISRRPFVRGDITSHLFKQHAMTWLQKQLEDLSASPRLELAPAIFGNLNLQRHQ